MANPALSISFSCNWIPLWSTLCLRLMCTTTTLSLLFSPIYLYIFSCFGKQSNIDLFGWQRGWLFWNGCEHTIVLERPIHFLVRLPFQFFEVQRETNHPLTELSSHESFPQYHRLSNMFPGSFRCGFWPTRKQEKQEECISAHLPHMITQL